MKLFAIIPLLTVHTHTHTHTHTHHILTISLFRERLNRLTKIDRERFDSIVDVYIRVLMVTVKCTRRKTVILCSLDGIQFTSLGVRIE